MNEGLRVVDITQKFGGLLALDAVNIAVYPGEIVGIIGPNGAGKTTLFNVISGVYQPTSGHIYLNDQEITNLKPYQISQLGFSRTFQNIRLFTRMNVLARQRSVCLTISSPRPKSAPKPSGSVKEPSRSCASWVLRIKNTICPAASPTVNSADWKSHVPWRPIPQSCSSTSLPQA